MKETELWSRMRTHLGPGYFRVWAQQQALPALDSRTVEEAIEAHISFKEIWRAVWEALELPASER